MANEVTFDAQAGSAFVSHNGQPIEDVAGPVETNPSNYEGVSGPTDIKTEHEPVEETTDDEDDLEDLTDAQRESLDYWKSMGLDAKAALKWCDTDECPFTPETYERFGPLLNDSDPETVKLAVGLISWAKQSPDHFDFKDEYYGTPFSEEQQHERRIQ